MAAGPGARSGPPAAVWYMRQQAPEPRQPTARPAGVAVFLAAFFVFPATFTEASFACYRGL